MEQALFNAGIRVFLLTVLFSFITACSPELNWRTVQSPEQRYSALFPGKPDKLERLIPYQEQELKQTLEAIKIENDIYSISAIQVPGNLTQSASKILTQLQSNLFDRAKASGGLVKSEDAFFQAANFQRLPTKDYLVVIKEDGGHQQSMRVRWITRSGDNETWIYQVSVLNTKPNATDEKNNLSAESYEKLFE